MDVRDEIASAEAMIKEFEWRHKNGERVIFQIYDLKAGTLREDQWGDGTDIEVLVGRWKSLGHRLVSEGLIVVGDELVPSLTPRFIPAGEMERIWFREPSGMRVAARLFIWEYNFPPEPQPDADK
jgi:hypothetical protein